VNSPVGRHPSQRTRMAVLESGKEALTHYEVVEPLAQHTLIVCRLETGRTHQIRVHMQSIGFALAGDPVYGGRLRPGDAVREAIAKLGRQALHATRLALRHPLGDAPLQWEVAMPEDMQELLRSLRLQPT